jgi:TatD DNase family protein
MRTPELTPEMLHKRKERAKKKKQAQTPEALASAAAVAAAEAEAKRESRRLREEQDAQALRQWGIKDESGAVCELVDIGANLVKLKSREALDGQLQRCELTGVTRVLVTGTSVSASRNALALARSIPPDAAVRLFCTAGVHPHDAKSCNEQTISTLKALAQAPECVAIGECGLDYDRMFSARDVQLLWFERQVALAAELAMPLFLHERDRDTHKGKPLGSAADLMRILDSSGVQPEKVCIHCFTGSPENLREYARRGYRIGLTGFAAMRARGAHVREAVAAGQLPLEQLLLETDAPFMKPDKEFLPSACNAIIRGQCEPCVVPAVARALAECYRLPADEIARVTTATARGFFGLPDSHLAHVQIEASRAVLREGLAVQPTRHT